MAYKQKKIKIKILSSKPISGEWGWWLVNIFY